MKTTTLKGSIKAVAEQMHPLQTRLSLILTDFEPNHNKQGIPIQERDKLIASAMYMPLKINFDGDGYLGHDGAIAVGPIINVRADAENEKPIVVGDAVIWKELYPDVSDHLTSVFNDGIGSSWEVYYEDSELDETGVEWLKGVVFAGTCIVEMPAYGPKRTRVLAIAEKRNKEMSMVDTTQVNGVNVITGPTTATISVKNTSGATIIPAKIVASIEEVTDTFSIAFSEVYRELFEKEVIVSNTEELHNALSEFRELVLSLRNELTAKSDALEVTRAELTTIKEQQALDAAEAEKKDKLSKRRKYLSEAGIEISDEDWGKREVFYSEMSDATFTTYVEDLKIMRSARSEKTRLPLPEPLAQDTTYTLRELADALRKK